MPGSRNLRIVCVGLACALCFSPTSARARHKDTAAGLTAQIQRQKKPVKKAKLEVRLGQLEIDQAGDAYDHQQIPQAQKLLSASATEMQDAWSLLKGTGRNAAKKPDGFMQLEMGLSESIRVLHELRRRTFYLYRGPVNGTIKTLSQMHSQVLLALFPGAAPPGPTRPGKAATRASQHTRGGMYP